MSINSRNGRVIFKCDCCPATYDSGVREFPSALAAFRNAGWFSQLIKQRRPRWRTLCPCCKRSTGIAYVPRPFQLRELALEPVVPP